MAADRPVLEAALETAEVVADIVSSEEVWSQVPLIGTAIKICKAADSFRDRMFAAKIAAFLSDLSSIPAAERTRLIESIRDGGADEQKTVECLLMTLERTTDLDKPRVLAALFAAFLNDKIESSLLRRLTQAVDHAFVDDIEFLIDLHNPNQVDSASRLPPLVPSGLAEMMIGTGYGTAGAVSYSVSKLGNQFRTAYLEGKKLLSSGENN